MIKKFEIFVMLFVCTTLCGEIPLTVIETPGEVEGVVTFARGWDPWFFVRAGDGAYWRIERLDYRNQQRLSEGDVIRAKGVYPEYCATPRLNKAKVEIIGKAAIEPPVKMTIAQMYAVGQDCERAKRDWLGRIIETHGWVIDINRRETFTQILLADGDRILTVSVPIRRQESLPDGVVLGAAIAATGVGVYDQKIDSVRNTAVDVADIGVQCQNANALYPLAPPPFWTTAKVWSAIAVLSLLAALAFGWAFVLHHDKKSDLAAADAIRRERLRLTSELHDNFQQLLAGCMFCLGAAMGKVGKDDDGAREQLEHLRSSLNHTQASLRAALWGLAEEAEGPEALTELFKYAAGRMPQWEGIVHFTLRGKERSVARQCSGALLLILQEAVGNAIRHGRATRVDVVVDFTEDSLVFGITDNGCGFEPRDCPETGHLGLDSIRRHAEGVGGTLTLKSVLGEGTTITVRIPL